MRLIIFNAKYSPNLGDGLLAECLERSLEEACSRQFQITTIDLAGRTSYGPGGATRGSILRLLHSLPSAARSVLVRPIIELYTWMFWRPVYRGGLVGSDVVVIGGGNLLTDIDLNFPKKLAAVLDESARRKLPVHIFAVGVANVWSPAGLRILRRAFSMARIESVCVRDEESRLNFNRLFADSSGREALLARDPGLLISRYRDKALKSGSREIVGLCLTSAIAVRYHSKQTVSDQYLIRWYIEVAVHLARAGYAVRPFTTGSPEDVGFAEPIIAKIGGMAGVVDAQLRPGQPSSLADVVSNCNLIIAFRMHALIAASSYGVPVLALRWDPKVDSFMNSLGNSGNVFDVQNLRPTKIVQVARRIIAQELDSRAAAPVFVAAAYADVLGLLDRIRHIDPVNEG